MLRASATRCNLAAGQRHHRAVGIFRQPDQRQRVIDHAPGIATRDFPVLERIDHVLPHRHVRPHRIGLEHHAEFARARRHQNAAFGRRHHPARDADLA